MIADNKIIEKRKQIFLDKACIDINFEYIESLFYAQGLRKPNIREDRNSYQNTALTFRHNLFDYKVQIDEEELILVILEANGSFNLAKNTGNGMHVVRVCGNQITFDGLDAWYKLTEFVKERKNQ